MDRQFDCRVMLANVQNSLSNNERTLLHFIIGNIVSRVDRENTTLGGTLNVIESLFQQEIITEDNLDFLIKIFDAINVKTAASRLQAFQSSKRPYKERHAFVTGVFGDNDDDDDDDELDKQATHHSSLLPVDNNSIPLRKIDEIKSTTTVPLMVSPEAPNISNKAVVSIQSKLLQKFSKSPLTLFLSVLLLLNILTLVIYSSIVLPKRIIAITAEKKIHQEVYQIKKIKLCLNITDGKRINHAQNLSLTFNNQLQSIQLYRIEKVLCSIEFIYSKTQVIKHDLKNNCGSNPQNMTSFNRTQEIREIIQYYTNKNDKPPYIDGLGFGTNQDPLITYGSSTPDFCQYRDQDYIFGYAVGVEAGHYLNGYEFFLYKICWSDDEIEDCMADRHLSSE